MYRLRGAVRNDGITCPECGSNLFRTKTVVPNALFTLLVIMALAGLGVTYNVLKGDVPKG